MMSCHIDTFCDIGTISVPVLDFHGGEPWGDLRRLVGWLVSVRSRSILYRFWYKYIYIYTYINASRYSKVLCKVVASQRLYFSNYRDR